MSISMEPGSFHPPARVTAWVCPLFARSGRLGLTCSGHSGSVDVAIGG
jgi:hypothetical protein